MGHCCQIPNTKVLSSKMPSGARETRRSHLLLRRGRLSPCLLSRLLSLWFSAWVHLFVPIYQDHCLRVILRLPASYQFLSSGSQRPTFRLQILCAGCWTRGRADPQKQVTGWQPSKWIIPFVLEPFLNPHPTNQTTFPHWKRCQCREAFPN